MTKNIILIHGMWANNELLSCWKKHFEQNGYNCITPNLPGHNKDDNYKIGNYSFNDFVDFVASEIENLEEKPVIIGHSMGGLIAHKLAEKGLAAKAVLLTPATQRGIFNFNTESVSGFLPIVLTPFFWRKGINPDKKGFDYICSEVPEHVRSKIFKNLVAESGKAFFEISMWALDFNKSTQINNSKITCPVLQIAAEKDRIISKEVLSKQAEEIKSKVKDFEFILYPEHGHGIIWENGWDKVADDIISWIEDRSGQG
jgi:pimeloyl-ACP methyl ester carboxylesterase